jgi:type IV secretory pathway protease TraF
MPVIAFIRSLRQEPDGIWLMDLALPNDTTGLLLPIATLTLPDGLPIAVGDLVELDGPRRACHAAKIRGYLVSKIDYRYNGHMFGAVVKPHRVRPRS